MEDRCRREIPSHSLISNVFICPAEYVQIPIPDGSRNASL